ncbi:MAG: YvcK family protein [Coriobacteriales bacterium]|jgi:uncharacterized cofD-like protein|nr:YvcK family protein [Coriobacteriales bacterium]
MTPTISKRVLAATRAVCIGGGTGVPTSIKALAALGVSTDAVVSVADDGGSSGLLRTHTGQVPPGDLRKCLVALAANQHNPWVKAFRERYEFANNHTLGNLILTSLQEATGSLIESIALCEQLLETRGHVHPATLCNVLLTGITQDGQNLVGQSTICKSETALREVVLEPADPPANPAAVKAILEADLLVLGPGSLFTSIIPNLLIGGIRDAIAQSKAATVFICPVADVQGETWGLDAAELTDALVDHGLQNRLDYVLINKQETKKESGNITGYFSAIGSETQSVALSEPEANPVLRPLIAREETVARIRARGAKLLIRHMSAATIPTWHDPQALAMALASVIADAQRRQ